MDSAAPVGTSITPDTLAALFQPFWRGDNAGATTFSFSMAPIAP